MSVVIVTMSPSYVFTGSVQMVSTNGTILPKSHAHCSLVHSAAGSQCVVSSPVTNLCVEGKWEHVVESHQG